MNDSKSDSHIQTFKVLQTGAISLARCIITTAKAIASPRVAPPPGAALLRGQSARRTGNTTRGSSLS